MNLDRFVFWIRLIGWAILDVLNALPGYGEESLGDDPPSGFKPERIQVWIGIFARAALTAVEAVGPPPAEPAAESARAGFGTTFKPERIQFWIKLIAQLMLAVVDELGTSEETGKSGERASEEVVN